VGEEAMGIKIHWHRVSVWEDGKILEMDDGDGHKAL
jgi:hypothetical protein